MHKHKNIFIRFFCFIGQCLKNLILSIVFCIAYVILFPFFRCKRVGLKNVKKDDEARVFVSNHYQMFGPVATIMSLPYKFRPWIIDKMMDEETVEKQMGLLIYSQYHKVPKFIKFIALKCVKNLMVFVMRAFKGIPVSRENLRANLETMKISTETLNKNKAIMIWPEKDYVFEGIGYFMKGFEHLGKYYYQKTGKCISFYPIFTSSKNKTMYFGKPIKYDPNKDANIQKDEIVNYLRNSMVDMYFENEVKKEFRNNMKKWFKIVNHYSNLLKCVLFNE